MIKYRSILDWPYNATFKYIDIPPHKTYTRIVNFTDTIYKHDHLYLPKGKYKISMGYFNKSGNNCIIGLFKTREVMVSVTE